MALETIPQPDPRFTQVNFNRNEVDTFVRDNFLPSDQRELQKIEYAGPDTANPFAFRFYDENKTVDLGFGKRTMKELLPISAAIWHFQNALGDPFGGGTALNSLSGPITNREDAQNRLLVFFNVMNKVGLDTFCYHDLDVIQQGLPFQQYQEEVKAITSFIAKNSKDEGIQVGWATNNQFSEVQFAHGAFTAPDPEIYALAVARTYFHMQESMKLNDGAGPNGWVFWGGREGYDYFWNTSMQLERENATEAYRMLATHSETLGMRGPLMIEPKKHEPKNHIYEYSVEAVENALREGGLFDLMRAGGQPIFQYNPEVNHADLARLTIQHEIQAAKKQGRWGALDINMAAEDGKPGWDTDDHWSSVALARDVMMLIAENRGFREGFVLNLDAKTARESHSPQDLVLAYVLSMDIAAAGLLTAEKVIAGGQAHQWREERYAGWRGDLGTKLRTGTLSAGDVYDLVNRGDILVDGVRPVSGGEEKIKRYIETTFPT